MPKALSTVLGLAIVIAVGIYRTTDGAHAGPIAVTVAVAITVFVIGTLWTRRGASRPGGPGAR